jgi:pilus assembly protein CpaB
MNVKTIVPLGLAVVLGLAAAMVAKSALGKKPDTAQAGSSNLTPIVVVKHPVAPGQELRADDLALGSVATKDLPDQAFLDVGQVVGRTPTIPLSKGQALVESLLSPRGAGSGVTALIPEGMRAITIEINEFSGLAGMISPGNRVDVVTTIQNDASHETVARAVVQNVKVIAIGQRTMPKSAQGNEPPEPFRSVTLLTSREDSEVVELVASTSRPRLVLRSGLDDKAEKSEGITLNEIRGEGKKNYAKAGNDPFGGKDPLAQPVSTPVETKKSTRTIKTIRGGVSSEVEIPLDTEISTDSNKHNNTADIELRP